MEDNSESEYLLLHYSAGHWDFPKGNLETGENEKQTTIREIWEETRITGIEFLDDFRMKIEYKYRHGKKLVRKEVVLYLVRARTRKVILSHEHIGFAWRKFDDAMQQLSYLNAKNLLSAAKNIFSNAHLPIDEILFWISLAALAGCLDSTIDLPIIK
ncbi:MAG TPA: NUDIX domain-containing protein [Nitrososphaera sp.]|nr:NUDIX domain-containing protein [Nitrososphaera sp.]